MRRTTARAKIARPPCEEDWRFCICRGLSVRGFLEGEGFVARAFRPHGCGAGYRENRGRDARATKVLSGRCCMGRLTSRDWFDIVATLINNTKRIYERSLHRIPQRLQGVR